MDEMTDIELIGYCEIHCATERALFAAEHVNRMIELAGNPPDFRRQSGWVSAHGEMQELCDLARARLVPPAPAIVPPVAETRPWIQDQLVNTYRYKALPRTVTPGGPIMATITEVFESENDNTRIIIETSNGGASLRAEKLSAPVAAGSVDNPEFGALLEFYGRMYPQGNMARTAQAKAAIIGSIAAWGAQQALIAVEEYKKGLAKND